MESYWDNYYAANPDEQDHRVMQPRLITAERGTPIYGAAVCLGHTSDASKAKGSVPISTLDDLSPAERKLALVLMERRHVACCQCPACRDSRGVVEGENGGEGENPAAVSEGDSVLPPAPAAGMCRKCGERPSAMGQSWCSRCRKGKPPVAGRLPSSVLDRSKE